MSKKNQAITNEARGKYFHIILNMADDDLNPYEYRLLGHYVRVGECWEGVRKTATTTRMSVGMIVKTRNKLEELGYIRVEHRDQDTCLVTVLDRMSENIARYAEVFMERTPRSWSEHPVHGVNTSELEGVHQVNERITITHEEEPKKEKDSLASDDAQQGQSKRPQSSALKGKKKSARADTSDINGANATTNPLPGSAVVSPAPRKKVLSRMERIINDAWRKGAVYLLPQLVGNAQQKGRKEWNVTPGMSESEVLAFGRWYFRKNAALNLPEDPRKVYEAVVGFRSEEGYDALIAEAVRDVPLMYPNPSDLPTPAPAAPAASREAHDAVYARLGALGSVFDDLFTEEVSS